MRSFSSDQGGRIIVVRMTRGELLREAILEAIQKEKIRNGSILSGLGTLETCTLHMVTNTEYPPAEAYPHWETPLELVSVTGIIADGEPHIHVVVGDERGAYAGHLENNCKVLFLAEIVIFEHETLPLKRVKENGIPALVPAEE